MIPTDSVFRLSAVRLRLGDGRLAYEAEHRAAIEAGWRKRAAGNARLWNGRFFMFEDVRIGDGTLGGTGRETDYATFLHWLDHGRPLGVTHITGTSLPVLADGSLFAVRMAAHTVNGGEIYFPAGSLDGDDIVDGRFDLGRNIARELEEETGFAFGAAERDFIALHERGVIYLTRRNRLPFGFDEAVKRLRRHQAESGDDEIETALAVRPGSEALALLKPHARALAEWHFENAVFSCSA